MLTSMGTEHNKADAARYVCYANPLYLAAWADVWVRRNTFCLVAVACFT